MSKQTNYIIGAIVIVAVAIVAYIGLNPEKKEEGTYTPPTTVTPATTGTQTTGAPAKGGTASATTGGTTTPTTSGYTMADVAKHNSQSSCWTAINGNVYDVTSWIDQHPGGAQAIISLCGIDGSSAFNDQHGGQRRPEQELASFKIGALK